MVMGLHGESGFCLKYDSIHLSFRSHWKRMGIGNGSLVTELILVGLTKHLEIQVPLFFPFLVIYIITMAGNLGLVTLIRLTSHLHTPMYYFLFQFSSVQFSRSVMSDSLWPHESQHMRPPCPSPTPGVYPNSCPLSRWCHSAISSSVIPFSSCPQSLPASESFPISQLFAWGGQCIGVSASASVLPRNTQTDLL